MNKEKLIEVIKAFIVFTLERYFWKISIMIFLEILLIAWTCYTTFYYLIK